MVFFAQSAGGGQVSAPALWNAEPIPLGLCSKNNPRNINYMPACPVGPADRTWVVIFFAAFLSRYFQRGILNKNPHFWMGTR
jgi:hypothetical protein